MDDGHCEIKVDGKSCGEAIPADAGRCHYCDKLACYDHFDDRFHVDCCTACTGRAISDLRQQAHMSKSDREREELLAVARYAARLAQDAWADFANGMNAYHPVYEKLIDEAIASDTMTADELRGRLEGLDGERAQRLESEGLKFGQVYELANLDGSVAQVQINAIGVDDVMVERVGENPMAGETYRRMKRVAIGELGARLS